MGERVEVPQATLERTREIVDAMASGAVSRAGIAAATGISLRQVAYGVASARLLGLAEGDDSLWLSPLGRALAATESGGAEETSVLRRAVFESESLRAIAPGLLTDAPPDRALVAACIRELAGLSENTAAHRAGMLFGWRKRLLEAPDPTQVKERHLGARWRRLEVRGFRSLEALSLDIGPLTVIHGPTGSGKTSVVEALLFAHDVSTSLQRALEPRGGVRGVFRESAKALGCEHRIAATREALEHSFRRHRVGLERRGLGLAVLDEAWSVVHQGEPLVDAVRGDDHQGEQLALLELPGRARELGRHIHLRSSHRLALEHAKLVANSSLAELHEAASDSRMRPDGSNLPPAIAKLSESRSYPGLLESLRDVIPGLATIEVVREEHGRSSLRFLQTLGPSETVALSAAQLARGALVTLGALVAATQLGVEELLVVELDELALDGRALAVVLEAMAAAARRATVVLTTTDEDLAQSIEADVTVRCEFRGGRTEVAAPGLRLL